MKRPVLIVAYLLFLVALAEFAGQVGLRVLTGQWPFLYTGQAVERLFEPHPYLVGVPLRGASETRGDVTVSINSQGFRGPEFTAVPGDSAVRVLALGGSTTFGTSVDDAHTWPVFLQAELEAALADTPWAGRPVEVVNAGVPGYTSAENLIQLALIGVHLEPDVVILFQGINDLHTAHSPELRTDYSDFHGPSQWTNLELHELRRGRRSALVRLANSALKSVFTYTRPVAPPGPRETGIDERALSIFRENLVSFAHLCTGRDLDCVYVPQVQREDVVGPYWFRYWEPSGVPPALDAYNAVMAEVARTYALDFVGSVAETEWPDGDFVDGHHFSPTGNAKFAGLLAPTVVGRLLADGSGGASPAN